MIQVQTKAICIEIGMNKFNGGEIQCKSYFTLKKMSFM